MHGLATTLLLSRVAASQLTLLVPEEHGLTTHENRIVHAARGGAVALGNLAAVGRARCLPMCLLTYTALPSARSGWLQCETRGDEPARSSC